MREGDPEWRDEVPVRVEAIPVRRGSRIIAVIGRNTNLLGVRTPSRLELSYLQTATDLTQMIARGQFPYPGQRSDHTDSPRVGDGFVRVDAAGAVTYASPNALSVYRQLGLATDLTGLDLAATTRSLVPPGHRADEETLSAVLGRAASRATPRSAAGPASSSPAPSRCATSRATSGRWCCSATSPTCAAGTASWSPRTPPSARSTTG